jgi:hypothetical protein
MANYTVLVIPGEREWTSKAMHLACAMARSQGGQVVLAKMVGAGHPALLGSPEGLRNVSDDERVALRELAATAQKYDVPLQLILFAYANYAHAVVSAAEQLGAAAVFAVLPASRLPFWTRYQHWRVQSMLARRSCALHTVEPAGGALEWAASATQVAAGKHPSHGR